MAQKIAKAVAGAIGGFALCFTPTVASATTFAASTPSYGSGSIAPFVVLAAYGTTQSQAAVCAGAAGAASAVTAAAGQAPAQGCVLPVIDPVAAATPVTEAPIAAPGMVAPATGFGFGIGAILAGLIAVAGLAAVALSSNGKGTLPISPD